MPKASTNYIVIAVAFSAITLMYWLAADPPNPRILAITGAGVLFSIGITLYKKRSGRLQSLCRILRSRWSKLSALPLS